MIKQLGKICFMLFCGVAMALPSQAADINHVNIAAFDKNVPGYEYEAIVLGRFSDFMAEMEKGSQVIFLNHTAGIKNHDVITFNADVLSEGGESGGFEDNGVNCSISFTDDSTADNTSYSVGGLCTIFLTDDSGYKKIKAIIPSAALPDTSQGIDVWVMIYEDEETGIAFYANVTTSH